MYILFLKGLIIVCEHTEASLHDKGIVPRTTHPTKAIIGIGVDNVRHYKTPPEVLML